MSTNPISYKLTHRYRIYEIHFLDTTAINPRTSSVEHDDKPPPWTLLAMELGPGRTEWAWAGVPFGKGLLEGLLPGRQLSRSRGPAREGGPHRLGLYPSALHVHPHTSVGVKWYSPYSRCSGLPARIAGETLVPACISFGNLWKFTSSILLEMVQKCRFSVSN